LGDTAGGAALPFFLADVRVRAGCTFTWVDGLLRKSPKKRCRSPGLCGRGAFSGFGAAKEEGVAGGRPGDGGSTTIRTEFARGGGGGGGGGGGRGGGGGGGRGGGSGIVLDIGGGGGADGGGDNANGGGANRGSASVGFSSSG